jgi:hypothetical protein
MTPSTTQFLFPSLIAVALASTALPAMAEESGFVEGAKVNLNLRNFYINRNFTNPTKTQGRQKSGHKASSSTPGPVSPRAPSGSAWMCWGCTR